MYIVSYDISSDRLHSRIAKTLEGYGRRVQYSVFECELAEKRYRELYEKLLKLMEGTEEGNICFYYVCKNCEAKKQLIGIPGEADRHFQEDIIVI